MDRDDRQFEKYLREFEPLRPRAFKPAPPTRDSWRRLAAAAGVIIALGTSLWLALHSSKRHRLQTASVETAEPARVRLSIVPLTKLATTDPEKLDLQLAAASRQVLPGFRGEESTLRVLAKE